MGGCGVLADIATVAQLFGLHAIMVVALVARLLRIPQCKLECDKLVECARTLHAQLQWPATTGRDLVTELPAMAGLVIAALVEATSLVDSYRRSTLWCRVWTGRRMETQFRDLQNRVNCLCALVLCVHANLLTQQPAVHPVSDANTTNHHVSDPFHGAEIPDSPDSQRYNIIGQKRAISRTTPSQED